MKRLAVSIMALGLFLALTIPAMAHFGMIIPSNSILPQGQKSLDLTLSFSHPFEGHGMDLVKPKMFKVFHDGKSQDLLGTLKETKVMGHKSWMTTYSPKRPGMYIFAMEPQAYPEPAEDNYIIHYTKTVVSAYDEGEDWNTPVGLKTEIVPLTRPWGNYAGNAFQGIVLMDGKPAPYTRVEVEYYNAAGQFTAPNDCMVTQEVLCDGNGVFTVALPLPGWWGFAGLNDADYKIKGKDVELGAVLWIELKPFTTK